MRPRLKWLEEPNHDRYQRAKNHELRLATALGGRRLTNSGGARRNRWDAHRSQGGDIESPHFLFEQKGTTQDTVRVQRQWWTRTSKGAERRGKQPALILTFERKNIEPMELVVIDAEHHLRLAGGLAAKCGAFEETLTKHGSAVIRRDRIEPRPLRVTFTKGNPTRLVVLTLDEFQRLAEGPHGPVGEK